jgi:hypothetical protein
MLFNFGSLSLSFSGCLILPKRIWKNAKNKDGPYKWWKWDQIIERVEVLLQIRLQRLPSTLSTSSGSTSIRFWARHEPRTIEDKSQTKCEVKKKLYKDADWLGVVDVWFAIKVLDDIENCLKSQQIEQRCNEDEVRWDQEKDPVDCLVVNHPNGKVWEVENWLPVSALDADFVEGPIQERLGELRDHKYEYFGESQLD